MQKRGTYVEVGKVQRRTQITKNKFCASVMTNQYENIKKRTRHTSIVANLGKIQQKRSVQCGRVLGHLE